jgi:hypothetical protein
MKIWTFKKFCDEHGVSDIDIWRRKLPAEARAKMDQIISYMEITPTWEKTRYIRPLVEQYKGILEIKFKVKNIQYRPLGCYAPEKTFIILFGAEKKSNRFIPSNAPQLAVERREMVRNDMRYVRDYYG